MLGRDSELAQLHELVAAAEAGRAGAVIVVGEPGIGKTTLLDSVELGTTTSVALRACGVQAEVATPYACLLQLVHPILGYSDEIPDVQRLALDTALARRTSPGPHDPFIVATATLSLLAAAAATSPVVAFVDDLQWVDPESATSILFCARRLEFDRVAIILATRDAAPAGTSLEGIPRVQLHGLSGDDARRALPEGTSPEVARQLTVAVAGNPLALEQVATRLTPAQRRGGAPLPRTLPVADGLDAVYRPLVEGLPDDLLRAALVVAASEDASSGPVTSALERLDLSSVVLVQLEDREVLVLEPGAVRFTHPLLRSTVWACASQAQRREVHGALADALSGDQSRARGRARTWHLAAATVGVDDSLADALEELGSEDERRGGYAAASSALERAAWLSSDAGDAGRRLVAAIESAAVGGDVDRARHLLDELDRTDLDDAIRWRALASLGMLERLTGSLKRSTQMLSAAAAQSNGSRRIEILSELCMSLHRLGRLDAMRIAAEQIQDVARLDRPSDCFAADYFTGLVALLDGDRRGGLPAMAAAIDTFASHDELRADPAYLVPIVFAAAWVGLDLALVALIEQAVDNARARGALAALVPALAMTAYGRTWLGDHTGAFADATEAAALADELGFVVDAAPAIEMLAWQQASRGDHDTARTNLRRAEFLIARADTTDVAAHFALTSAYCALCRDDITEVVATLEPWLQVDDGRGARGDLLGIAPMLVEGYARLGNQTSAAELADLYDAIPDPDPSQVAAGARCQALAAGDDPEAARLFEAACAAHDAAMDEPFEIARTRLLFGSYLRRTRRRRDARVQLNAARAAFASMGLDLWVGRCTAELATTDETVRHARPGTLEQLSPQECRVAALVCRGMTNAEVAAALFVSPKTVEHHLSSVYRKRGVRSRTELAAVWLEQS